MTGKRGALELGSPFLSAGLQLYQQTLKEILGRFGATTAHTVRHKSEGSRRAFIAAGAEPHLSDESRRAVVAVLRAAALALVGPEEQGSLRHFRLFDDGFCLTRDVSCLEPLSVSTREPEELGELLELLLGGEHLRKQRGRFYTPRHVVDDVVARALAPGLASWQSIPRVIDPACGGGAFLFGVARALDSKAVAGGPRGEEAMQARRDVARHLHGCDIEPLAVAVTELSLAVWAGEVGSSLERLATQTDSREVTSPSADSALAYAERFLAGDSLRSSTEASFDLVIGNPPWVAYAGRAAKPLSATERKWLAAEYRAFHGYPTLQACFVELAAKLSPNGRLALLLPSPVADLDGYRPLRQTLTTSHVVSTDLVEYGQDAFDGVVQPCFALIADAAKSAVESAEAFRLAERGDKGDRASRVEPPEILQQLRHRSPFPRETFRELGFQTTTVVTKNLLLRTSSPVSPFVLPLLEGRDVAEFSVGDPRLYLNPDRDLLRRARCKLRPIEEYQVVDFVVRQTAKYTIAALHSGHHFRNTLIAGFGSAAYGAEVMVGLLNSTLLRALHLASQRDARQKTFPQVKLSHLRALPAPPPSVTKAAKVGQFVRGLHGKTLERADRTRLDAMVFEWYGVSADEATGVERFYVERGGVVS